MLDIIIFSKDRAAQLDLCLQSISENLYLCRDSCSVNIVYTSSTPEFQSGYDFIKSLWRTPWRSHLLDSRHCLRTLWFGEKFAGDFKKACDKAVLSCDDYIMFMTDDDIVYRQMSEKLDVWPTVKAAMEEMGLFTISLRLGTNTFIQDQYYNSRCIVPDPVIQSDELIRTWNWREQEQNNSFAYPFSVDGHIFRKKDVRTILDRISEKGDEDYYNPNSMEGKAQYYFDGMLDSMGCFENSYVINTPLNRVQETCTNKAGEYFKYPPEELNQKLLDGERLTLKGMDFSTIIGCHQEVKLCWAANAGSTADIEQRRQSAQKGKANVT